MAHKRKEIADIREQVASGRKKYVRYNEGAEIVSMGVHSFMDLAEDAKAKVRYKGIVLVDMDKIYEFLELLNA